MRIDITVIIVNYNSGARLAKCIAHLKAQQFRHFEMIIVDNASSDDSIDFARDDPATTLLQAETNLGFAAANNLAARQATGTWLAFLNPDAYAAPNWLAELMAATERHPSVSAFGSTQVDALDPSRLDGAGDVFHAAGVAYRGNLGTPVEDAPAEGPCFSPCAAAALYRKSTFDELGGFDERFFCYCEDVDLGFRLRLEGGEVIHAAKAIVYHEGSAVTGRHSAFSIYHGNRNRIWTYLMNMPAALLAPTLPYHLVVNLLLLIRYALMGHGSAYWRAVIDALKNLPSIWKQRRKRQQDRIATARAIARALVWSPVKLFKRTP